MTRIWEVFLSSLALAALACAQTATETVLHTFGNFTFGANPYAPVTRDIAGNLYGTTYQGGQANVGVVYKVDPSGKQTVLHSFSGGEDGGSPYGGVIRAGNGDIFGTTYLGGKGNLGVVFRIDPSGHQTVLHSFTGGADGANPWAGVTADAAGNLYGTTFYGGAANAGVAFKIDSAGRETVLYNFTGKADGGNPRAPLVLDSAGNLYGTTYGGGSLKEGVIYKLSPAGIETVLHTFNGSSGGLSSGGVVFDAVGNLYGAANTVVYKLTPEGRYTVLRTIGCESGGATSAGVVLDSAGNIYGTTDSLPACGEGLAPYGGVYRVDTSGAIKVIYAFPGASRFGSEYSSGPNAGVVIDSARNLYGATPYGGLAGMVYNVNSSGHGVPFYVFPGAPGGSISYAGVTRDSAGNLYGVTQAGGSTNAGVVYEIDASGRERALYSFTGGADGKYPESNVVLDSAGNIYGTTLEGGASGQGVVFRLDRSRHFSLLFSFTGGADGNYPNAGVVLDPAGNLYGTACFGGSAGAGVVYKMTLSGAEER